jgi:tetraacyldisaccharide 4'-kinase
MKILLPFAWLYGAITDFRNYLYDKKKIYSARFEIPMICVGNLAVGGTGKTPHIEYLINFLKNHYQIATLSRGYGRKTKGFLLADKNASARTIGDEPMQFFRKFGEEVVVSVGEDRALAVPQILYHHAQINLILLDDAFQHRGVNPDVNILLTDYKRLFFKDNPFPAGRLRERRKGAKRADIIIVTKCPSISEAEEQAIISSIRMYNHHAPVFFTSFVYQTPQNIFSKIKKTLEKIVLVSAIAQPKHFEVAMNERYSVKKHFIFPDHHSFSEKDLHNITTSLVNNPEVDLVCTEKDAVKMQEMNIPEQLRERFFSVGIEVMFLRDTMESEFQKNIMEKLKLQDTV